MVIAKMNVIRDLGFLKQPLNNPVLTIGNFDGVHKGHLALFDLVKKRANAVEGQSVVMTFDPHPLKVIKKGNGPSLITNTDQKLCLIAGSGIDVIICLPFTPEFASIPAEAFVREILLERIGIKEVVVGYDYTFGRGRAGNVELLQKMGKEHGFKVHLVGPIHIDHTIVSSTSIRKLIGEGDLAEAKRLLGRDYQIWGTVVKGANRGGRVLGFPTANIRPADELVPRRGVYVVHVKVDEEVYRGVTNVGFNPTFGENSLSIETHILDFSGDLVGKPIEITFQERIRDERSFNDVKELSAQIARDIEVARGFLQGRKAEARLG